MGALQTQPTVSPTLIHQIQRGNVKIVPNIREICENSVRFHDGTIAEDVDVIINCTGYTIDLPFLPHDIKEAVLDEDTNEIKLYKYVFSPEIGPELAFIGFVQPATGGILSMSELQAQWLAMIIKGRAKLPSRAFMNETRIKDKAESQSKYYKSTRHTIQEDPITYNDQIAEFIGARPSPTDHISIAHRLLLGSGGVAQWTLKGPFHNQEAEEIVKKVPVPPFSVVMAVGGLLLMFYVLYCMLSFIGLC